MFFYIEIDYFENKNMKKAQQGIFKIVDPQNQPQVMEKKYLLCIELYS